MDKAHVFRPPFIKFWFNYSFVLFLILLVETVVFGSSLTVFINLLLFIMPVVCVISVIYTGLVVWYYKISISSEGIEGRTTWGRRLFVKWEDIHYIKNIFLPLGYFYVRIIHDGGKWSLLFPLYLGDKRRFEQTLVSLVPEDNPLRRFIIGDTAPTKRS